MLISLILYLLSTILRNQATLECCLDHAIAHDLPERFLATAKSLRFLMQAIKEGITAVRAALAAKDPELVQVSTGMIGER